MKKLNLLETEGKTGNNMKKSELIKFRKLVNKEIERRKRIEELLNNELVKEYLKITNTSKEDLDANNISEIIDQILKSFEIKETNGIYVCTRAWYVTCSVCYEDTNYYSKDVAINSKYAEYRIYTDIETRNDIKMTHENNHWERYYNSTDKEPEVILNPYNTCDNINGYNEVRQYFFENALEYGQATAKKLVLAKYPRL